MKKIIAFLILLLCLKQSYAQYPLKQYLGSDSTLVTVRGGMNARVVLWSFTDTTQANTQRISQYAGALIYTTGTDKVWYRNSTATGWIEFTSSGGTTTNIYNSDGFITGTRVLDLSASPLTFSRSGVKQFAAEDNLTTIGSPNNQKRITVYNDSITILGLSQTTDTTTYKPLAIDGNGYFTIMDRWPGGGGSTPTLQQVLTAGSTLTGNNTITGGLYSFKFTAQNLWSVDTARQWRLRSFRQSDSSMQLIQSSNYGVSGLKRINISSQDTAYISNIIIDNDHLTNEVYERNPLTLKTAFIQAYNRFSFQGDTGIMVIEANNRKVGIITDVPDSTLHVVGGLKFVTGRQGAGKVLTSDANGGADWATPSGGSTPTLQQVLTAGSTLTGGNTIDADGNDFSIDNIGEFLQIRSTYNGTHTLYMNEGLDLESSLSGKSSGLALTPLRMLLQPSLDSLFIDSLAYTLSTTGKKILIRDTATGLVQNIDPSLLGASSYTFTNGLTDSSGTVKLGGTLTETTTINGNGNEITISSGVGVSAASIYFDGSDGVEIGSGNGIPDPSMIRVKGDSISFFPVLGRMNIDTLAAASNMTNKKVMVWDTVTKRWEQIAKDSVGGGGSTSPAGNYGNVQLNRNGAFATPASDSLDYNTTNGFTVLNKIGAGTATPDSLLTVETGAHIKRGLRLPGLSSGENTDSILTINSGGTVRKRNAANIDIAGATEGQVVTYVSGNNFILSDPTGVFCTLPFIVGTTSFAPEAGDSVFTIDSFQGKYLELYRNGELQYFDEDYGIEVDTSIGRVTVHPPYEDGEKIIVKAYDYSSICSTSFEESWVDLTFTTNTNFTNTSQVFTPTAAAADWQTYGLDNLTLTGDGSFRIKYQTSTDDVLIIGFNASNTSQDYTNYEYGAYLSDGGAVYPVTNGSVGGISFTLSIGEYLRLNRTGSTFKIQSSTDGDTWTDRHTFGTTSSATHYVNLNLYGGMTVLGQCYRPQGFGLQ